MLPRLCRLAIRSLGAATTPGFVIVTTRQLENDAPPAIYHGAWYHMIGPNAERRSRTQ
jgi:hypothetical protein